MSQAEANVFLQSLRGNQAVIVLAYLTIRRAMTIEEIETCTGLDNDTVRANVKKLASKGWLFVQRGERGRQTWLPAGDTYFGRLLGQNPKISDSGSSSSSRFNSPPLEQQEEESQAESENFGFCLKACDEVGIRDPKRKQISKLEHVTPELIRGHVKQAVADGLLIGTAIYRIENNWPLAVGVNVETLASDAFFCEVCHQHPCSCAEHDDDCMCISCRYDHPERFCGNILKYPRGVVRTCNGFVRPGESTCDECIEKGVARS